MKSTQITHMGDLLLGYPKTKYVVKNSIIDDNLITIISQICLMLHTPLWCHMKIQCFFFFLSVSKALYTYLHLIFIFQSNRNNRSIYKYVTMNIKNILKFIVK